MANYNKQTVAQLRQLLRDRGIASTGLTRKAQIVEKLEEADQSGEAAPATDARVTAPDAGGDAPAPDAPPADANDDAPPDAAEQAQQESGGDDVADKREVPRPALAETGEPAAQPPDRSESAPLPVTTATLDANREAISHIDSDTPPPDQIKAIGQTAEDTTMDEEPGTTQPAAVFNAAPADSEDVVGPRITEPTDEEMEVVANDEPATDELPDAPGPAAEALRYARQEQELTKNALDTEMQGETSAPATQERPSVEKPELPTIPERSTAETSRLNTEELEADSKKRKRRSHSPSLPYQDIKAKKARMSEEPVLDVRLREDDHVVMEQGGPEEGTKPAAEGEKDANDTQAAETEATDTTSPALEPDTRPERKEKTDRYRNLVKPSADNTSAILEDRPIVPALHPATPALYIRNFMRPLRPDLLRAHLVSLASPPSGSPDPSVVKALFVDAMKTHALVLFANMTAASRARASLHGSIWPPEANRKELWVDFVPDDSVEDWIKQEEDAISAEKEARAAGRPIPAKRFEVVYPESSDGSITAVFQEVGSGAPLNAPRGPRGSTDIRRPSQQAPLPVAPTKDTRQDIEQSFKTLDQLFSSTTSKPSLYYLPVSDTISELRLKELDNETSRDWAPGETRKGRGIKTEMKYKYTFDDRDRIVEVGEDRGPWAEDYRGRGGYRGRGRGGYRGRGDVWRG